jgi:hypothetical protein
MITKRRRGTGHQLTVADQLGTSRSADLTAVNRGLTLNTRLRLVGGIYGPRQKNTRAKKCVSSFCFFHGLLSS